MRAGMTDITPFRLLRDGTDCVIESDRRGSGVLATQRSPDAGLPRLKRIVESGNPNPGGGLP